MEVFLCITNLNPEPGVWALKEQFRGADQELISSHTETTYLKQISQVSDTKESSSSKLCEELMTRNNEMYCKDTPKKQSKREIQTAP